ncbi:MAG TPA: Ku protein [Bacteroidota bacterium]|nr:Ku protein [Bacteroidota bacterium]
MKVIWKGSISSGLVNIPVRMFTGGQSHNLDFDILRREDLREIKYKRVCKDDDKEVPWEDIVKGQTLAAPYSVRPKPMATVSTPLKWKELKRGLSPENFTKKNMLKRLERLGGIFLTESSEREWISRSV